MNTSRTLFVNLLVLMASLIGYATPISLAADLDTTIRNMSPDYYWAMNNSFSSEVPNNPAIWFSAFESATPDNQSASPQSSEYFPLFPDHMTAVPNRTAMIFGETTGDLVGASRYLQLPGITMDTLGMWKKDSWTLHMVVSPDEDAANTRGYETLFDIGGVSGAITNRITLDVDRRAGNTFFRLRRTANGIQTLIKTKVPDANAHDANGRYWFQIIVRYDTAQPRHINLRVNGIESSLTSNGWITISTPGDAYFGNDNSNQSTQFNGAMHFVALWKTNINLIDIPNLEFSLSTPPTTRPDLSVDWYASPTYYMWTVPTKTIYADRDMTSWIDPLWDRTGVWPMVRFKSDRPDTDLPPGDTASYALDANGIANQTKDWIEYVNTNLSTYTSSQKDLNNGYLLLLQNWGKEKKTSPYADRNASRALMRNWRDSLKNWRDNTANLVSDTNEIHIPYYREGMSYNAIRTKAVFSVLSDLLTTNSLPSPTRLHFDTEARNVPDKALPSDPNNPLNTTGWWHAATTDNRANDAAYWASASDTLFGVTAPGDDTKSPFATANDAWAIDFSDFALRQYDFAFGVSLLTPAVEVFGNNIRASEYNVYSADTSNKVYSSKASRPSNNTTLAALDFSSPVLYPLKTQKLHTDSNFTDGNEEAIAEWDTALDLNSLGIVFQYDETNPNINNLLGDLDNIFVELAKHNIQSVYLASGGDTGKPAAPWMAFPGQSWDISQRFDVDNDGNPDGDTNNPLLYYARWQNVARIAVFAYRHGTREFIFWGSDATASTKNNVEDLEKVLDAIEYAEAKVSDVTSTGATSRSNALFGVPDGMVTFDDSTYYLNRWNANDPEADITGNNGHPDGAVNQYDLDTFLSHYKNGT